MSKYQTIWNKVSGIFEYNSLNASGCMDVIVVEDEKGLLSSTPFHFHVGKFVLLKSANKEISVFVNGQKVPHSMRVSLRGISYWEYECAENEPLEDEEEGLYSDEDDRPPAETVEDKSASPPAQQPEEKKLKVEEPVVRKKSLNEHKDDLYLQKLNITRPEEDEEAIDRIELSLSAHLINQTMDGHEVLRIFSQHLINFTMFDKDPYQILNNEKLLIRVGRKIYDRNIGFPQIISLLAFNSEMTPLTVSNIQRDFKNFENSKGLVSEKER